jgi:RNA methyltransferase, TrmH family
MNGELNTERRAGRMNEDRIRSKSNPRVVHARKLLQRKHRLRQQRFLAEGLQILRRAVEQHASADAQTVRPVEVFFCETLFSSQNAPSILAGLVSAGAKACPVTEDVLDTLSSRVRSQGLVAVFSSTPLTHALRGWDPTEGQEPKLLVLLDRPQYPGNVGTVLRTADAVGAEAVVLLAPAADPLDPKAIRASMGSVFAVPILHADCVETVRSWSARRSIRWVATDADQGAPLWSDPSLDGSVGLLLGNEGEGLHPELAGLAEHRVRLPQRRAVDSLNVSVAGGILMYEWLRRQQAPLS